MLTVVVVGGGVSGLATAHFLRQRLPADTQVTVLEREPVVGGKIRTRLVAGLPVDTGPDAFLSRATELRALIAAMGLGDEVVAPVAGGAFVWSRGRLRRLPAGTMFGVPERLRPLIRSGLLSPAGTARAGLDLVLPATSLPADPSVGELIRPRFGAEVFERLVQPLIGGVHAGNADELSAQSTVPEIAAMARRGRSLTLTLRARRRAAPAPSGPPAPPLVSLAGGMVRLTAALAESLGPESVVTGARAVEVAAGTSGGFEVRTEAGPYPADHVVLATPAHVTARLVEALVPQAALHLREIPYVDVANVTLAFLRSAVPTMPEGTGFLVPPVEGELIVGCTWLTSKWPHLVNDDVVLVRSLVGRRGDSRWLDLDDAALVSAVRDGLRRMMGITAEPIDSLVQRWPASMPQYTVGHAERLARIDEAVAARPGLHLTGAAYRGVGLAGCVAQAQALADAIARGSDG